jgi:hypothetical protein
MLAVQNTIMLSSCTLLNKKKAHEVRSASDSHKSKKSMVHHHYSLPFKMYHSILRCPFLLLSITMKQISSFS